MTQQILERDNHYTMESGGVVRVTLVDSGPPLVWRLGFDELELTIRGSFPSPRSDQLRGTLVTVQTTPRGVVLDALASGVVPPGIGAQYVERAAAAFFPRLPAERAAGAASWADTLTVTEILQGITTEVETIVTYTVADTSAVAGRSVIPIEYEGRIDLTGAGTVGGARVSLEGAGRVAGHYLYDPADRVFDLHEQEQVLESTLTLEGSDRESLAIPSRQVLRARAERLF